MSNPHAAPLPPDILRLDKETTEVGLAAAMGGAIAWIVQRVLTSPDNNRDAIAALRTEMQDALAEQRDETQLQAVRLVKLESRLGSDGDVGTVMRAIHDMVAHQAEQHRNTQTQIAELTKTVQALANRRSE